MKKTWLMVAISACLILIVSSISYGQGGTSVVVRHPTYPLMLKINDGAPCTTNPHVRLTYNHCVGADPCPSPGIDYWKGNEPATFPGQWQAKTQFNWMYHDLSLGYGKKKVNFRTSRDNYTGSAEIDYLASCEDAAFKSQMDIQILKLNQPFSFDIGSIFSVSKISNPNNFEIALQVMGAGRRHPLVYKTIPYPPAEIATGDVIKSGMNLTIPVPVSQQGSNPAYTDIKLIATIRPRSGATNVYDYNPNNNVLERNLQLVSRTINKSHVIDKCTGPEGDKNNILSDVIQDWVSGQITLSLHDCGTTGGEEIKCDSNPLPKVGQRGVKWTHRPTTGGQYGVHWWCEGLANKRDNSPQGYYFRFNVNYNVVDIRIP
jgi:hypothetical protein